MTTPESRPTYVERDGEILPSYTGVNVPHYPTGEAIDSEPPHDFKGSGPLEVSDTDATPPVSQDGPAVSLNYRDVRLLETMDKWAEANKLEGLATGMQTPAHRSRLGADDELAANAAEKARRLKGEAKTAFEAATGVHEMQSSDEITPEVLLISFFQDFKNRYLLDKKQLDKRRNLHRKNMQRRA